MDIRPIDPPLSAADVAFLRATLGDALEVTDLDGDGRRVIVTARDEEGEGA